MRLQPEEEAALAVVMQHLELSTVSDALRAGLRLLAREVQEELAAEEIRAFYAAEQAPMPDGVAPMSEEELKAADEAEW